MSYKEYTNIIKLSKVANLNISINKLNNAIKEGVNYDYIINNLHEYV